MKHFTILTLLLLLGIQLHAQTEKGNAYISGDINLPYLFQKTNFKINRQIDLNLDYGYFIKDNWMLKSNLGATFSKVESESNPQIIRTVNLLNATLAVQRFFKVNPSFFPYVGVGVKSFTSSDKDLSNNDYNMVSRTSLLPSIEAGFMAILSSRLVLIGNVSALYYPEYSPVANLKLTLNYSLKPLTIPQISALSHTNKNNWLLGGNFNVIRQLNDNTNSISKNNQTSLSISGGYFVSKGLLVGLELSRSSLNYTTDDKIPVQANGYARLVKSTVTGISPFVKKYFGNQRLTAFVNLSIGMSRQKRTDQTIGPNPDTFSNTYSILNSNLSYGLAYLVGDRLIIEGKLGEINYDLPSHSPKRLSMTILKNEPALSIHYVLNKKN